MKKIRPVSVPLITSDPFFNVWSMGDNLYDDFTRHWTGKRQSMTGLAVIDGTTYRFMGKVQHDIEWYYPEPEAMKQTDVTVNALTTIYTFTAGGVMLKASFMAPLFPDDLKLLSRPAAFIKFDVSSIDNQKHDVRIWFDMSGEHCVNDYNDKISAGKDDREEFGNIYFKNVKNNVLHMSGDGVTIDWGSLHIVTPKESGWDTFLTNGDRRKDFAKNNRIDPISDMNGEYSANGKMPLLCATAVSEISGENTASFKLCVMYDDIKSIEYFKKHLDAYWKKDNETFSDIMADSVKNFDKYMDMAAGFDSEFSKSMTEMTNKKHTDILCMSFRQCIAAHKLVLDENGKVLFLSKENYSNGCINTVDVSYPSMPLMLYFNPELAKGLLRGIFKFAESDVWKYDFAPHDLGQYPLANGQVYGMDSIEGQMPVEECGNMILITAAACIASGNNDVLEENFDTLKLWCEYLEKHALDPANQLCTDDFTGHLAHNTNLAIKGIVAIGAFGYLCGMRGQNDEKERLISLARGMAKQWKIKAKGEKAYRLAYDREGTWSLKYNIIWDKLFGLEIFDEDIRESEAAFYMTKLNMYGVPLDCRETYTKVDFLMWAAAMIDDEEYFTKISDSIWNMLNEATDRIPFTDWYHTHTSRHVGFVNRSVVGGLFIRILDKSKKVYIKNK